MTMDCPYRDSSLAELAGAARSITSGPPPVLVELALRGFVPDEDIEPGFRGALPGSDHLLEVETDTLLGLFFYEQDWPAAKAEMERRRSETPDPLAGLLTLEDVARVAPTVADAIALLRRGRTPETSGEWSENPAVVRATAVMRRAGIRAVVINSKAWASSRAGFYLVDADTDTGQNVLTAHERLAITAERAALIEAFPHAHEHKMRRTEG